MSAAPELPTLAEAARRIKAGDLSPVALTEACLERIDRYDGRINAFHEVMAEEARRTASLAEDEIRGGNWRV